MFRINAPRGGGQKHSLITHGIGGNQKNNVKPIQINTQQRLGFVQHAGGKNGSQ